MADNKYMLTTSGMVSLYTLYTGVMGNRKVSWFPNGDKDYSGDPINGELRCFAHDGGGFLGRDEDVRDHHVHISGTWEHWLPVRDVMRWIDEGVFVVWEAGR